MKIAEVEIIDGRVVVKDMREIPDDDGEELLRYPTKQFKFSLLLAVGAWGSFIVEAWLLLFRVVPADKLSWIVFALFFVVGVFSSLSYTSRSKTDEK